MANKKKALFKKFYKTIDGIYASYWFGRFTNIFIKQGKKFTAENCVEQSSIYLKIHLRKFPLSILLENLLKFKPTFNLGVIVIRGKERHYPVLLKKSKQIGLPIRWVVGLIGERREWYLSQRIFNELLSAIDNKHYILIQKRDKIFKSLLKNRSGIRYSAR